MGRHLRLKDVVLDAKLGQGFPAQVHCLFPLSALQPTCLTTDVRRLIFY